MAQIGEGKKKLQLGERGAAAQHLQLARETLVPEIGLLPGADAFARVAAAESARKAGCRVAARRPIQDVPVTVAQVQARAPLVPIRFSLREAAAAAEAGHWQRAQRLVSDASNALERLQYESHDATLTKEFGSLVQQVN